MPERKDWRNHEGRARAAAQGVPAYKNRQIFEPELPPAYDTDVHRRGSGYSGSGYNNGYQNGYNYNNGHSRGHAYDNYAYEGPPQEYNSRFRQVGPNLQQVTPVPYTQTDLIEEVQNDGPMQKQRKCRDVICLGIFGAAATLMVVIIAYSISKGSIDRIIHMTDSSNCDLCGIANPKVKEIPNSGMDLTNSPNVIFLQRDKNYDKTIHYFLPDESFAYHTQCVRTCPVEFKLIANRCVPKTTALKTPKTEGTIGDVTSFFEQIASDFERSWIQVIWMCAIALGLALLMTILLRLFAGLIIWVTVAAISLVSIGGSVFLWLFWRIKKNDYENGVGDENEDAPSSGEVTGWLVAAIVASVVTVIILLLFLFMRKRIALLIKLFNEAGKAIHAIPLLIIQPLLTFATLAIALSAWLIVLLLIESSGDPKMYTVEVGGGTDQVCVFKKNGFLTFSRWWNLFMIGWITQFIVGCQHLVIAGAVAGWFFTRNKSRLGFPLLTSFKRLIRYHLGSVAFGSLIIAIVKLIRYILNTIQNRLSGDNAFCKGVLCCCKCCIWCLENFLIFLNRNAYIEIAIHGYGFCKSARKAFKVLVDNALRVAAINSLGDFVLFLAKVTIVAVTVLVGYQIVKDKDSITHKWVPLVIGGICSYFIAHCFISVYEMAIDTVFICFCEDCDMNDGISKPYYMSKGLMEFVKNSEKALRTRKERRQPTTT
jgi:solute carrier family 44 protein 1 (choline transporter-like protein)